MTGKIVGSRSFTTLGTSVLAVALLGWGILPAFDSSGSDFANYYTASRLGIERNFSDSRYYRHYHFQQALTGYFPRTLGSFLPFPPPTALVMIPLVVLKPAAAKAAFAILNILLLGVLISLLRRVTGLHRGVVVFLTLLNGLSLWRNFQEGQLYLLLVCSLVLGIALHFRGKNILAGLIIGTTIPIKYFGILFVLYFAATRNFRLVLAAVVAAAAVVVLGMFFTGPEFTAYYYTHVLPAHLEGNIQDPYNAGFQSMNSLLNRLLVFEPSLNPTPVANAPALKVFLRASGSAFFLALGYLGIRSFQGISDNQKTLYSVSVLSIFGLLTSPASASYHFVLLIPAMVFLYSIATTSAHVSDTAGSRKGSSFVVWALLLYAFVNLAPFHRTFFLDGKGWLTVLAYGKLFSLAVFFLLALPRNVLTFRRIQGSALASVLLGLVVVATTHIQPGDGAVWGGYAGLIIRNLSVRHDTLFYEKETPSGFIRCSNGSESVDPGPPPRRTTRDGTMTAFDSSYRNNADIFLKNNMTGAIFRLTENQSEDVEPVWSDDEQRLFFLSDRGRGIDCTTIYVLPLAGRQFR